VSDASHAPDAVSAAEAKVIERLGSHCFGCGPDNPEGLHLSFVIDASDPGAITSTAQVELTRMQEGPPGYVHGGIIATLMDEAMSKLNRPLGVVAMTRHMEVDYLRPVPQRTTLTLVGRHVRREGRKLFHTAELTGADGRVLARAKGVFVVIDREMLARRQGAVED
jgi:uncharacterized protein (TIGR00369 family)